MQWLLLLMQASHTRSTAGFRGTFDVSWCRQVVFGDPELNDDKIKAAALEGFCAA